MGPALPEVPDDTAGSVLEPALLCDPARSSAAPPLALSLLGSLLHPIAATMRPYNARSTRSAKGHIFHGGGRRLAGEGGS